MILIFFFALGAVTADLNIVNPILPVVSTTSAPINPLTVVPSTRFLDIIQKIINAFPESQDFLTAILGKLNAASFPKFLIQAVNLVAAIFPVGPIPEIPERSWGEKPGDTSIRPFTVQFTDEMIADLRSRIKNRRNITRSLSGSAHTYGTNADFLSGFLDHWANQYDFQGRETFLNKFPQFLTSVQDLDIHYIHVKPSNPQGKKVLPLLLLHGWPVTAFEYIHVIDYLRKENEKYDFVFEIIVPDLPGYGYSQGTNKIGLAPYEIASIMKNLMLRLGHPRFYVHCYDVSQFVGDAMAVLYPEMLLGLDSSFAFSARPVTLVKYVLGQLFPPAVVEPRYESRMYTLIDLTIFYLENFGYLHLQATRPDNVGHGLDDSPVTLASWILENYLIAADPVNIQTVDGNAESTYDVLDLFDTLTVYWATQTGTTSVRLYAELLAFIQNPLALTIQVTPIPKVPFTAIRFRHELIYMPDDFLRDRYQNLVYSSTLDVGGHFGAFQYPDLLADHIWLSIEKMEAVNAKQ